MKIFSMLMERIKRKEKADSNICENCCSKMVRMSLPDYFGIYGLDSFKNPDFVEAVNNPLEKDPFMRKENLDKLKRLGLL